MITKEMLRKLAPNAKEDIIVHLAEHLNDQLAKYNINTYLRVCHFLAQAAHESASFRTLEEFASGAAYEGRKDLGNVQPGDGKRYKGRGIFQLTGRANYRVMGQRLGYELEHKPELAADPMISIKTACEYWNSRSLSIYADLDDVLTVTKKINGGYNGLEDRKQYLSKAKAIIPRDLKLSTYKVVEPPKAAEPADPFADVKIDATGLPPIPRDPLAPPIVVAKKGDVSDYVGDLQAMLFRKGYKIITDGNFGPRTEAAVKDFQKKMGLEVTGIIDTDTLNRMMV
jgi:putative chitinase